ncbi:MAG: SIMPL domain-containing protein [Tissierellales bacterium]|jgi:uncharacterized protein YggE|nr:SIMPL domain-containing protein [Tissierellales bacterium]
MKKIASVLLIMVMMLGSVMPAMAAENTNFIAVSGQGSVWAEPDQASIEIGVKTENKDTKIAQEENAKKMASVMKSIKANGLEDKDIQTIEYSIYPLTKYNEKTRESELYAYRVVNRVKVDVDDIDKVGKIIDDATKAGSNQIGQVNFTTSKSEELYLQALAKAISSAKMKASAMSKAAGVVITTPSSIVESASYVAPYRGYENMMLKSADAASTSISQGQIEIRANVSMNFNY